MIGETMQLLVGECHKFESTLRCRIVRMVDPSAPAGKRLVASCRFDAELYDLACVGDNADSFLAGLACRLMAAAEAAGMPSAVGRDELREAIDKQYRAEGRPCSRLTL